jgi:RimJ/RimL family protein N-acetyltransferase
MCANLAAEWTVGLSADEHEIGWWLLSDAQGRGLAKEAASALRDEAFEAHEASSVVACIHPGNSRSIAVAEAIGLTHDFATTGAAGQPLKVYRSRRLPRP